jgi:hypothetical protein
MLKFIVTYESEIIEGIIKSREELIRLYVEGKQVLEYEIMELPVT